MLRSCNRDAASGSISINDTRCGRLAMLPELCIDAEPGGRESCTTKLLKGK